MGDANEEGLSALLQETRSFQPPAEFGGSGQRSAWDPEYEVVGLSGSSWPHSQGVGCLI